MSDVRKAWYPTAKRVEAELYARGSLPMTDNNIIRAAIDLYRKRSRSDGDVVGSLNVRRFRGADSMVNHDFEYLGNLPDGTYELIVRQPSAPATVPAEVMAAAERMERPGEMVSCVDTETVFLWLQSLPQQATP